MPEGSRDTNDPLTLESHNGERFNSLCIPSAAGNQCTFRLSIAQLRGNDYDAEYHLSTQLTAYDHYTEINVTSPLGDYRGILPYATVNYQPGAGAGGTAPSTQKSLTDTPSQTAPLTIAGPDTITRPEHSVFNKWQASHGSINPRAAQVPASIGETDATGRTIISLTAAWTKLATPEVTTAKRDAANNQATIAGTAKPLHSSDIVRICHSANTGSRQCQDITPDSKGQDGTALPNNGTSEHPWNITLPIADDQGELTVDATLISKDTAYTGNPEVQSATASATTAGSTGDDNNDGTHDTSDTPSEPNTPNKGETPEAPKAPETKDPGSANTPKIPSPETPKTPDTEDPRNSDLRDSKKPDPEDSSLGNSKETGRQRERSSHNIRSLASTGSTSLPILTLVGASLVSSGIYLQIQRSKHRND